jgi:hypothetical protein
MIMNRNYQKLRHVLNNNTMIISNMNIEHPTPKIQLNDLANA